jgi:digeranylgeranylglycerophospholipid reductase
MEQDCVVVGASFAGLACATSLARSGARVTVLERKRDPGAKLHTTGILVRDVLEQVPLLDGLPAELVRRVSRVRLYTPSLSTVDLSAPGYFFLTTDTPRLMRWLAERAQAAGAAMHWGEGFVGAARTASGFDLGALGRTSYLVGADGPRSSVARALALGQNRRLLAGIEHEYEGVEISEPDYLHCFIDRQLMPGYIGWVVQGVGAVQVGLARRLRGDDAALVKSSMAAFLRKIAPLFRFGTPASVRAGLIPCGGLVRPVATRRALLVGDAAGMVSPVTAGGIHMALKHGLATGHAIADFLSGRSADPAEELRRTYPAFRTKRLLRFLFDHFQSDMACNLLLSTAPVRRAACLVYFHRRAVFEESRTADRAGASTLVTRLLPPRD